MGDEENEVKVVYLDGEEGSDPEETNWISRPGRALVTYPDGSTYEGSFDGEKLKSGEGVFVWRSTDEEGEMVETARYEGGYSNGRRNGVGKFTMPNKDTYEGEWVENEMHGEGTYTYHSSGDIYSGQWEHNQKNGEGRYEFGKDKSQFAGVWSNGNITSGSWILHNYGSYEGSFSPSNHPIDAGSFTFSSSNLSQKGSYEMKGNEEEGETPQLVWNGESVVVC